MFSNDLQKYEFFKLLFMALEGALGLVVSCLYNTRNVASLKLEFNPLNQGSNTNVVETQYVFFKMLKSGCAKEFISLMMISQKSKQKYYIYLVY